MRLTNFERNIIVRKALQSTFEEREKSLAKVEEALAQRVYKQCFGAKNLALVAQLPANWFRNEHTLWVNANGRRVTLKLEKALPVPYNDRDDYLVIKDELAEKVVHNAEAKEDLKKERNELETKLTAQLSNISTSERLEKLWPEGKKFYKGMFVPRDKGGLPALRFDDINAKLGLEKVA